MICIMMKELRDAGADFYLLKSKDSSAVVEAIRSLMHGRAIRAII
jgi:DNA-binding NarL/FixJ family response regulator